MLFTAMYKIKVNKAIFLGFRGWGAIAPIALPRIRPWSYETMNHNHKSSHGHCVWNRSHNHDLLQNILSFQSSPDIQICIYQFYTHSVSHFNFSTLIRLNTCSISALECGIGYIKCDEQNQPVFCMCFLRWHLHASILQSNMLLCQ